MNELSHVSGFAETPRFSEPAPPEDTLNTILLELEDNRSHLTAQLRALDSRLRLLRVGEVCPLCGGTGRRRLRGGLYGELQQRPCRCQE
jgi:hypothetical protein